MYLFDRKGIVVTTVVPLQTASVFTATGSQDSFYVEERFKLDPEFCQELRKNPVNWGFGLFSEVVYYRTYSRALPDGGQENWADTVIRVVEGVCSIRKDWYRKHGMEYSDLSLQGIAQEIAKAIFDFKFLPPGRSLWAMGTDYVYKRGNMALNNCGFVDVRDDLGDATQWAMDALMCGVGVGFSTQNANLPETHIPEGEEIEYIIPDSREGWTESVRRLIDSYFLPAQNIITFNYDDIRPAGVPLRGFGGVASGPGPLIKLHERLRDYLTNYNRGEIDSTRLITDTINAVGACVVAGNIRRSAELATGSVSDETFLNLKNYELYPERSEVGWMSNNSVILSESHEFELLPTIAERIRDNGEPGIINMINIQKYGRVGKKQEDFAIGMNPCAEIPLEDRELCNLAEIFPVRCVDKQEVWEMMSLATFYASTVSLLPSHSYSTNVVVSRNRRIGVSVSGIADWIDRDGVSHVTMVLRDGYERVIEPYNKQLARQAGVQPSIRLTTVKPSGTISLLAGVSPGMNWPVGSYVIRRMRFNELDPMVEKLQKANVPNEPDVYSDRSICFEFPLASGNGKTRSVNEVSVWEQAALAAMLQREWSDNAVSNTLTFQRADARQIERVLANFAPLIKSISMLPDQEDAENPYAQAPYERITEERYQELRSSIHEITWQDFGGVDGMDSRFCDTDVCEIP